MKQTNGFLDGLKALFGKGGVCPPDTKTPACKAGDQVENNMSACEQSVQKTIPGLNVVREASDTTASVIFSLAERADGKAIPIAPGIAQRILDETNFEGQRRVMAQREAEHVSLMRRGWWIPERSELTFAMTPDRKLYLVDGQHRLHATVRFGQPVGMRIKILRADNMHDVRRLYATFDAPSQARTDAEMLAGVGIAKEVGLRPNTVKSLYMALSIIRNGMEPPANRLGTIEARSRSARLENIGDWTNQAKVYEAIVMKADSYLQRKLLGQGCMAVAMALLKHQPVKAAAFFNGIAQNDGLRKNDPRARLIADFQMRKLNAGGIRQSVQQVAVAWNAFYEGRDLSQIRCTEGASIVLKGVPSRGLK